MQELQSNTSQLAQLFQTANIGTIFLSVPKLKIIGTPKNALKHK